MRCLRHRFGVLQKLLGRQTKQVQKSEKRVGVLLGGYVARQKGLVSRVQQLHRDLDMSRINFLCFSRLAQQERESGCGEGA